MPKKLFWLTIGFYVIHQLLRQPDWVLGGEMWAEMATNYFHYARSSSFFERLFATDAGYIPIPQRIIALIVHLLHIPTAIIPYVYTWTAIVLTGMIVGSFCLEPFRKVIQSDAIRFMVSIAVLWVVDFETRTFVNFTYFSGYLAAIVTALVLSENDNSKNKIPGWTWILPILLISKPAVLSVLPAMALTAVYKKDTRFRWITGISVLLAIGQIIQIMISERAGVMPIQANIPFGLKILATVEYFFGMLGSFVFGLKFRAFYDHYLQMGAGLFIFLLSILAIRRQKDHSSYLIIVGLSLLLFNVLINCFALSDAWNTTLGAMDSGTIYRHIIIGFEGSILIVVGIIIHLSQTAFFQVKYLSRTQVVILIFCAWFVCSGLFNRGKNLSKDRNSVTVYNSQWQLLSKSIDENVPHTCIPIDPLGWTYPYDCSLEANTNMRIIPFAFQRRYSFKPLPKFFNKTLTAFAIIIKPQSDKSERIEMHSMISLKNGQKMNYHSVRKVDKSGSMIYVSIPDAIPFNNIESITLAFDHPSEVAYYTGTDKPVMLWMGY